MAAIANINSTLFAMNTSLLKCQMFSKIKDKLPKLLTFHPLCDGGTSVFLEGVAEGAIAVEPTLLGQCHGGLMADENILPRASNRYRHATIASNVAPP